MMIYQDKLGEAQEPEEDYAGWDVLMYDSCNSCMHCIAATTTLLLIKTVHLGPSRVYVPLLNTAPLKCDLESMLM